MEPERLYPFQVLVDVDYNSVLQKGLVIPKVMRNLLPKVLTNVEFVDETDVVHVVSIGRTEGLENVFLGPSWTEFVESVLDQTTKKLCFRHVRGNKFQVFCFEPNGIEYIVDRTAQLVRQRCLLHASETCLVEQLFSNNFFSELNVAVGENGIDNVPRKTVSVVGRNQGGYVNVVYKLGAGNHTWVASGFNGPKWTNICVENDIEAGYTLMFCKTTFDFEPPEFGFLLDVFTEYGVGIGESEMYHSEDEYIEWTKDEMDIPEQDKLDGCEFMHECRVKQHPHDMNRPHFYTRLTFSNLVNNYLTLDWDMVGEFELKRYPLAMINYGDIHFWAEMKPKYDGRRDGEQNHMILQAAEGWANFAAEAGLVEGDYIRLQLNLDKFEPDEMADIDIC